MSCRSLTLILLLSIICLPAAAQGGIEAYTDRNAFSVAATDVTVHDFEGIVPNSGFKHYQREGALRYAGLEFRTGGGGRFGPGPVMVVGGWYQAGPAYETTTGAKLHWSPPNQAGDAFLDVTLPGGVTAAGTDLWTVGAPKGAVEVTVTTADGKSRTEAVSTPPPPSARFIGFTSASPIVSLRFVLPKGQTALIVDNFTTGRASTAARGETRTRSNDTSRTPTTESENRAGGQAQRIQQPPADRRSVLSEPARRPANPGEGSAGVIAYVRGSTEIRLVNPDGSDDKKFWSHPDLNEELGIFELAWKPDGSELAFSSAHEATVSLYLADIYTVKRDGSGLRKITNPPDRAGSARFPKGSVTVTVTNYGDPGQSSGTFIVYVAGADEPQQVVLPAGASKTLTFKNVADFGRHPQPIVAMFGKYRWFVPGADVVAGRNITAPAFPITGKGYDMLGAFRPVWSLDGSKISYRSGLCVVSSSPAQPTPGAYTFNPIFGGKNPMGTCTWDSGPTAATAGQIIYSENGSGGSAIYQIAEGGTHPGTRLTQFSDIDYQLLYDLRWLPDASGLLYSTVDLYRQSANIFRYDFSTKRTMQVTKLEKEFARTFSVSPDGRTIVFEKCPTAEEDKGCDLWTIGTDGNGAQLLVKNGQRPAWGK